MKAFHRKFSCIGMLFAVFFASTVQASGRVEVVRSGDTLATISFRTFGTHGKWMQIFKANRHQLSDPNQVEVGMELVIPAISGQKLRAKSPIIQELPTELKGSARANSRIKAAVVVREPAYDRAVSGPGIQRFEFEDVDLREELEGDSAP